MVESPIAEGLSFPSLPSNGGIHGHCRRDNSCSRSLFLVAGFLGMAFISIKGLVKRFGATVAVDGLTLEVEKGSLVTLLGPSGCGKTTTLRCLAGLDRPDTGEIEVDGESLVSGGKGIFVPPENRGLGMVFQSYAIWPHMSVFSNVAFPLQIRGISRTERRQRVQEALNLVGLGGLGDRPATQLSGGQQQRVAVARALVYRPRVLLFDEPLSNLDAKLRERMRFELLRLQREIGITTVYVTHDQGEAMAISDQIVVMNGGRIAQIGTPQQIYTEPETPFVADFIGVANFLEGTVASGANDAGLGEVLVRQEPRELRLHCLLARNPALGEKVLVAIRAERLRLFREPPEVSENVWPAEVLQVTYLGDYLDCQVLAGGQTLRARVDAATEVRPGGPAYVWVSPTDCAVFAHEKAPEVLSFRAE